MIWALLSSIAVSTGLDLAPIQPGVGDGPEPSPSLVSWELDFEYQHPRRILVQLRGEQEPTPYWYMLYTVTNPSPRTQRFFPMFELVAEDLQVHATDIGVSPLVFNAIRERHRRTHPYLVSPTEAIGDIRTGDDYAIESVAIWRADLVPGKQFTVYVGGLSGETKSIPNPAYDPSKPESYDRLDQKGQRAVEVNNPKRFTLRKTLQLVYRLPGSLAGQRALLQPKLSEKRWIMR
jgi:hypothetical protein